MPANRCLSGARTDGYIPTIRAAGFNGTADIILAAECRKKTFDRLDGGGQCEDTSDRSNFTASRVPRPAANANDRLFFIGPTTVGNFDSIRAASSRSSINATSAPGQQRKSWLSSGTSALPPIPEMQRPLRHVGFVPITEVSLVRSAHRSQ